MRRHCKYCNNILRGRSDKKYCDDLCRSAYNNNARRQNDQVVNKINSILNKNRSILKKHLLLCSNNHGYCDYVQLINQGFAFEYFTHLKQDSLGHVYQYCYDIGLCKLNDGRIMLRSDPKTPQDTQ